MKLPEDKNERIKLYVLAGVVGVLLVYIGGAQAVKPMLTKRKQWQDDVAKLRLDLDTTRTILDFVNNSHEANRTVVSEIVQIAEQSNCVLRARLGNYLLEAEERIQRRAAAVNVPVEAIKEVGISKGPSGSQGKGDGPFGFYTVHVETRCGMHDFIRLLQEIENQNPYLCVSRIGISSRSSSPATHAISVDIQWPIWQEEDKLEQIKDTVNLPGEEESGDQV